jgi:hypothetical protein
LVLGYSGFIEMVNKTNLIHRHKLTMRLLLKRNEYLIRGVYKKQKPLILRYIRSSPSKTAIIGLPLFFKVNIKPLWLPALKKVWLNGAEEGEAFVKELHGLKKSEDIRKDYQDYADKWLDQHAGTKINGITDTDQEWLANTIRSGVSEGLSTDEMASNLSDDFDNMSDGRAATIVRTETGGAFNYASNETAKDSLPDGATKTWRTTSSNPRPTHEDMDGTEVGINDSFEFEDGDLEYPCDPSGPAAETVNCMCVLEYSTGALEEGESELSPEEEESALSEASMEMPEEE